MDKGYYLYELNKDNLLKFLKYDIDGQFSIEELLEIETLQELGLEYAIVYNFDAVQSDKIENIKINIDNIIEGRFFNENKEIRIFRDEEEVSGTIFIEKENTNYIEKNAFLYPRDRKKEYPERLTSRRYIDYDEDNQGYIRYTKPCKLHFKEEI